MPAAQGANAACINQALCRFFPGRRPPSQGSCALACCLYQPSLASLHQNTWCTPKRTHPPTHTTHLALLPDLLLQPLVRHSQLRRQLLGRLGPVGAAPQWRLWRAEPVPQATACCASTGLLFQVRGCVGLRGTAVWAPAHLWRRAWPAMSRNRSTSSHAQPAPACRPLPPRRLMAAAGR